MTIKFINDPAYPEYAPKLQLTFDLMVRKQSLQERSALEASIGEVNVNFGYCQNLEQPHDILFMQVPAIFETPNVHHEKLLI